MDSLLLESGDFLLLEDGSSHLLLEDVAASDTTLKLSQSLSPIGFNVYGVQI